MSWGLWISYNKIQKSKASNNMKNFTQTVQNDEIELERIDLSKYDRFRSPNGKESETKGNRKRKGKKSPFTWTKKEEAKYINFLKVNQSLFLLTPKQRKIVKINVLMANRIKSRSPAQCHSHHQKMMQRYKAVENIITTYVYLFGKQRNAYSDRLSVVDDQKENDEMEEQTIHDGKQQANLMYVEKSNEEKPLWWEYALLVPDQSEERWNYFQE